MPSGGHGVDASWRLYDEAVEEALQAAEDSLLAMQRQGVFA
ncbi:MAG: hypothetical protein AB1505_15325 [Candidatus Latescibacterota bacterium]